MTFLYRPNISRIGTLLMVIGMLLCREAGAEPLLVIGAGLFSLYALKQLLFAEAIEVTEEGVTTRGTISYSAIEWGQIESVQFKGTSFSNGYRYSAKIILQGSGKRIVIDGDTKEFEGLYSVLEHYLLEKTAHSLEEAEANQGLMGFVGGASFEDYPQNFVDFAAAAAIFWFTLTAL